jgi:hypothetical protein
MADDTNPIPEPPADARLPDVAGLQALQDELVPLLDEMISSYVTPDVSDDVREHLEVLRVLLKAQAFAYLEHITSRTRLFTSTSEMYEDEVKLQAPLSTTLKGLVDGGTLTPSQAARLAGYVSDRRTMLIFGDRATGKSTLLNALLEMISVDERFVSIEQHDHLPALEQRSFCVRLSVDDDTDLDSLFAKALKMQPNRIVIGEVHGDEILFLLKALESHPQVGGFCTLRADSVHKAVAKLVRQMELHVSATDAKRLVGQTRPVLVHLRSDEKGLPRLAAIWSVDGIDAGNEIVLSEQTAGDAQGS